MALNASPSPPSAEQPFCDTYPSVMESYKILKPPLHLFRVCQFLLCMRSSCHHRRIVEVSDKVHQLVDPRIQEDTVRCVKKRLQRYGLEAFRGRMSSHRAKSSGYTKHRDPAPANPPEAMLMAKNFQKFSLGLACYEFRHERVTRRNRTKISASTTRFFCYL